MAPARVEIKSYQAAQRLQDDAAERCSMTYRAPELFNVESPSTIDERTDIWVRGDHNQTLLKSRSSSLTFFFPISVVRLPVVRPVFFPFSIR